MSRRNSMPAGQKTSGGGGSACDEMRREVERLIERERFKDAFKQAKLCFRKEESPENHRLLERTYLLRITELAQGGMPTAAAEVAGTVLEFGVTDQSVLSELVLVLPRVGMADKAAALMPRLNSPQTQATLSLKIADRAVLQPEQTPDSMPELRAGGLQIRAALAALDANDETQATERLQDIPRSSPFADWRYFVRGLAAFRRGETEPAKANWDRLDPQRAAHKIATVLRQSTVGDSQGFVNRSGMDQSLLEVQAFGEPVLARLEQLRTAIAEGDWKDAVRLIGPLRFSLQRIAPRMAERLTDLLLGPLIAKVENVRYEVAERLVRDFTKAAQPLPLDPHWNRLWALLWERQGDINCVSDFWQAYIRDVDGLEMFSVDQRRQVKALVWKHLAEEYAVTYPGNLPSPEVLDESEEGYAEERQILSSLREKAVKFIERSLELDPGHRATYELLLLLNEEWKQPDEAAAAARRMLAVFPDDAEALDVLIDYHDGRDEPELELSYIERLRTNKPLDDKLGGLERHTRKTLARHFAIAGRWDEGRAQFDRVERDVPESKTDFRFLVCRCAFEFKAGQGERAEAYLTAALKQAAEPAAAWLYLSIEARRYNLSPARKKQFDDPLRAQLKSKVRGEVAGALVNVLGPLMNSGSLYPGRDKYVEEVTQYLARSTRTKYQMDDLEAACTFLQLVPEENLLLEKLTRRGLKNFPKSPVFLLISARLEAKAGPFSCNYKRVRKQLNGALALLESKPDPRYEGMAETIQRQLLALDDVENSNPFFGRFPNFGGGKSGMPPAFARIIGNILDNEEDLDLDLEPDFEPGDFAPPESARFGKSQAGASRGKQNRKK